MPVDYSNADHYTKLRQDAAKAKLPTAASYWTMREREAMLIAEIAYDIKLLESAKPGVAFYNPRS